MITITIKTDNAAFDDGVSGATEVARILRKMAEQLDESAAFRFATVRDTNGNTVGRIMLTGKDRRL